MFLVGLMSGTSADGIDVALVEITEESAKPKVRPIEWLTLPFSDSLRGMILDVCAPKGGTAADICVLDALLGHKFADAAEAVCAIVGMPASDLDAIACHGQTIWHQP